METNEVSLLSELMARSVVTHDDISVGINVLYVDLKLFLARYIRCVIRRHLRLALGGFAHGAGAIRVWQLALSTLPVGADAVVSIVRALDDVTLITISASGTIARGGEWAADRRCRGHMNMRIAACTVRTVATDKESARRNTMVGHFVGHVAVVAVKASASLLEVFANSHFVGVVDEAALGSEGTGTCSECQCAAVLPARCADNWLQMRDTLFRKVFALWRLLDWPVKSCK